jgi:hypothetical protein
MASFSKHLTEDQLGWLLVGIIILFLSSVIHLVIPHSALPAFFFQLLVLLLVCGGGFVFALRKYGNR